MKQYEFTACKKEPNPKTRIAVINVVMYGETIPTVSRLFCKACNIKNRIVGFQKYGIDALSEKPRSGCRPKTCNHKITEYLANKLDGIFPKLLARDIKKQDKVRYTESGIRDILRRNNFTPKVPDAIHKRKAAISEIEQWQKELKPWISCVKRDGFELFVQDETYLKQDGKLKSDPWSPKGQKIRHTYFGSMSTVHAGQNTGMSVSAENPLFENHIAGPQVIEVTISDPDIGHLDLAGVAAALSPLYAGNHKRSRHRAS